MCGSWNLPMFQLRDGSFTLTKIVSLMSPAILLYYCITAIEQAWLKLEPHNAEELRATMRGALGNSQEPTRNITKQEVQVLLELKNEESRVILMADKGVAIVIMDKEDYQEKAEALLEDRGTYKAL